MKFVDEYRDPALCQRLVEQIRHTATRRWTIMEVCGGQTHGLLRYGIDTALADVVELIHGPGCPVCVTPAHIIDQAVELGARPEVILTSFGDMLRVPGTQRSLLAARASGADVRLVYSPLDAVRLAQQNPARQVVFLAVGFETTTPATAVAALQARALKLDNFALLVAHVRVQPAMELLMRDPECRVHAFLAAGHVCTVTGYAGYHEFVRTFHVPVVVTGFEPADLLAGLRACVQQLEQGEARVENCYPRSAVEAGNASARDMVEQVFEVADQTWRGLGGVPGGGLRMRPEWQHYDARHRYGLAEQPPAATEADRCRSGDVLTGRLLPSQCEHFGTTCRPEHPLGAPMVSSEGACAAYYRYARQPLPPS